MCTMWNIFFFFRNLCTTCTRCSGVSVCCKWLWFMQVLTNTQNTSSDMRQVRTMNNLVRFKESTTFERLFDLGFLWFVAQRIYDKKFECNRQLMRLFATFIEFHPLPCDSPRIFESEIQICFVMSSFHFVWLGLGLKFWNSNPNHWSSKSQLHLISFVLSMNCKKCAYGFPLNQSLVRTLSFINSQYTKLLTMLAVTIVDWTESVRHVFVSLVEIFFVMPNEWADWNAFPVALHIDYIQVKKGIPCAFHGVAVWNANRTDWPSIKLIRKPQIFSESEPLKWHPILTFIEFGAVRRYSEYFRIRCCWLLLRLNFYFT